MVALKRARFLVFTFLFWASWHLFLHQHFSWDLKVSRTVTVVSLVVTGTLLAIFLPGIFTGRPRARRLVGMLALAGGMCAGIWPAVPVVMKDPDLALTLFSLSNLWPNLLLLFSSARLLTYLAEESAFRLWDPYSSRGRGGQASPISIGAGLFLGFLLTFLFYTLVATLKFTSPGGFSSWLADTFFGANPLYYPPVLVFWWAMALLSAHYHQYFVELLDLSALRSVLTRLHLHGHSRGDLDHLRSYLGKQYSNRLHHRPIRMALVVLNAFQAKGPDEADVEHELQTALHNDAIQASRGFIHALVTTLPLLGFLGTVVGISQSITEFGAILVSSADEEATAAALSTSLSGLGVAFETTLIGLVTAIISSLFLSYLEKRDQEFLVEVELFCQQELLGRLRYEKA